MRGGAVIFPKVFTGLVTFPSFHTIFAVLMINAAAYLPGRSAKIIIILLNLAMIASTITDGGHYLADVLGGAIIAVVVICISNYFIPVTARFANLDNKAHAKG